MQGFVFFFVIMFVVLLQSVLQGASYLTSSASTKQVLHLELSVPPSVTFSPGDAIGIHCPNTEALVDAVLAAGGWSDQADQPLRLVPSSASSQSSSTESGTLRDILRSGRDLTFSAAPPKKSFLRVLAEYCPIGSEDRDVLLLWSSRQGSDAFQVEIVLARPTLADLLGRFPSCRPDLAHLLSELPPPQHRLYSITNSPLVCPESMHIALSLVEFEKHGVPVRGLCSGWLHDLCRSAGLVTDSRGQPAAVRLSGFSVEPTGLAIPVFIKRSQRFKLPDDTTKPVIMIGPGTGVAPFRGFLQHRAALIRSVVAAGQGSWRGFEATEESEDIEVDDRVRPSVAAVPRAGAMVLFYGGRTRETDFLYADEFAAMQATGVLSQLCTAFSREGTVKVYVQHRMREMGAMLAQLLVREEGYFFVCGYGFAIGLAFANVISFVTRVVCVSVTVLIWQSKCNKP